MRAGPRFLDLKMPVGKIISCKGERGRKGEERGGGRGEGRRKKRRKRKNQRRRKPERNIVKM